VSYVARVVPSMEAPQFPRGSVLALGGVSLHLYHVKPAFDQVRSPSQPNHHPAIYWPCQGSSILTSLRTIEFGIKIAISLTQTKNKEGRRKSEARRWTLGFERQPHPLATRPEVVPFYESGREAECIEATMRDIPTTGMPMAFNQLLDTL
jgi:hypothetical protein